MMGVNGKRGSLKWRGTNAELQSISPHVEQSWIWRGRHFNLIVCAKSVFTVTIEIIDGPKPEDVNPFNL